MTVNVNETVEKVEKFVVEEVVTKTYDLIGLTATELKIIEALIVGGCIWGHGEEGEILMGLYEVTRKVSPPTPAYYVSNNDPRTMERRA